MKEGIAPVPEAPIPVAVLLLVQETVAPALLVVQLITGTIAPSQYTLDTGVTTVGEGVTVMLKLLASPLQVPR